MKTVFDPFYQVFKQNSLTNTKLASVQHCFIFNIPDVILENGLGTTRKAHWILHVYILKCLVSLPSISIELFNCEWYQNGLQK